jgi:hypothetical protein
LRRKRWRLDRKRNERRKGERSWENEERKKGRKRRMLIRRGRGRGPKGMQEGPGTMERGWVRGIRKETKKEAQG